MTGKLKKMISIIAVGFILLTFVKPGQVLAVEGVSLFTPYTGLSATPGETINYSITVINSSPSIKNMSFSVEGLPDGWQYKITADGREIKELSVRGNSEEKISLDITSPLDVQKADYRFSLLASDGNSNSKLPFLISISEQGALASALTSDQANLQGNADSKFTYTVTLRNRTADTQNYALSSSAEKGWGVSFKTGSDSVTSVKLEPNDTQDITVEVTPPEKVKAGTYKIPIKATSGNTSAELELEAVITGTYELELTTPSGKLSTDITAGKEKIVDLVIKNTGTAPLTDVSITAKTPPNWESEFDRSTIPEIEPGKSATVKAKIKASDDAIAGDYVTTFTATAAEKSADATFRISVKTSTLWGIVAVLIIAGVVAGLYYIVKKYGRR